MNKDYLNELCGMLVKIRSKNDAVAVLKDILTPKELESVAERIQIVKLIMAGVPHRKISKTLKVSIAKVTRGSRALKNDHGGFSKFLKRK